MAFDFGGRVVLVTGAAHGLGREMVRSFAARGAVVWGCDILADPLEETQRLAGGRTEVRLVDVRDRAGVQELVREAARERGRVDVLVNNAGGVVGQVGVPVEEVTPEAWEAILDVNLKGAFHFAQAVAPGMKEAGWGRIVNISSGAGLRASLTGIQAYASAKAGLIGLTRQLAHELGPHGITVNCVAPGFVLSNPTTVKQWEAYGRDGQQRLVSSTAVRRLGTPEDVAFAVLFFASESASWITGQTLSVDGGRL